MASASPTDTLMFCPASFKLSFTNVRHFSRAAMRKGGREGGRGRREGGCELCVRRQEGGREERKEGGREGGTDLHGAWREEGKWWLSSCWGGGWWWLPDGSWLPILPRSFCRCLVVCVKKKGENRGREDGKKEVEESMVSVRVCGGEGGVLSSSSLSSSVFFCCSCSCMGVGS